METETRLVKPRLVVSIDPGNRSLAWAGWADGRLVGGGLSRTPNERNLNGDGRLAVIHASQLPPYAHEVIMEGMVVQRGRTHDPADMLALQAIGSFVAGHLRPEVMVWTNGTKWKNDRPKEVQHRLDQMALFPDEVETRDRVLGTIVNSLRHNFLDAMGIGLHYLRRQRKTMRP